MQTLVQGCLSGIQPCGHQERDPTTICSLCQESHDRYVKETRDKQIREAKQLLEHLGYIVTGPQQ